MRIDYNELVKYCKFLRKISSRSDDRIMLIRDLLQKSLIDPEFEIADDQVIVSSNYSDEVIVDIFFKIYHRMPVKIIPASDNSKIVRMK